MGKESPSCSEGETNLKEQETIVLKMDDGFWDTLGTIANLPPGSSSEGSGDDHNNPVPPAPPAPPAAPVPPAAPADQLMNAVLEVANEPAGPLELPTMRRNMEAFFRHFESRRTSKDRIESWVWTEFSLDRSLEDEKEHILATIDQIKGQYPPNSLSPAQAKDLLHEEVNRWLKERGRESLNLRKTKT